MLGASTLLAAVGPASALSLGGGLANIRRAASVRMAAALDESSEPLKFVTLSNSAGDSAKVYLFGACVTSYVKDGVDSLMVRPDAKMDGSKPISGGIPHCFPQFGPGAIQQHGFARNCDWAVAEITDGAEPTLVLSLTDNDYTRGMWDYSFDAKYTISLKGDRLDTELCVTNTGAKTFDFTAALHSYWSISAVDKISITGDFDGATFLDKTASPPAETTSESASLSITKEVDSVYQGVSGDVVLNDSGKGRKLTISNLMGWEDTVLWNPYGDEGMGFNEFVCVESAKALSPVVLGPNEYWSGAMAVVPSAM